MSSSLIDVSKMTDRREVSVQSESVSLLQIIERAARDPSVDLDRMERLLLMHERLLANQAKVAYAEALARLQPTLPLLAERGEIKNNSGNVQSRYALWEDIVGVITPLLSAQGFALSFRTGNPDGKIRVTAVLTHSAGHNEDTSIDLPPDESGSKNKVQAVASSVSYGKRYTAGALLNFRSGELDDDAQSAGAPMLISEEQIKQLRALLKEANVNEADFLKSWNIPSLGEIPAFNFDFMADVLEKRKKRIDPRGNTSEVDTKLRDKRVTEITDLVNEYGNDENALADKFREYHAEYLQPFPELFIAVNDKLAKDGVISKGALKKLMSLGLQGSTRDADKRW